MLSPMVDLLKGRVLHDEANVAVSKLRLTEERLNKQLDGSDVFDTHRYKATYLLQAFLLACEVRRDDRLRRVIVEALKMMFPTNTVETLTDAICKKKIPLPSAATLSQFKFIVDVAFMMVKRKQHQDASKVALVLVEGTFDLRHF